MSDLDHRPSLGTAARRFLAKDHRLLIGGDWIPAADGARLTVHDPANEEAIATVAAAGAADVDRAVSAARAAFEQGPWPALSGSAKASLLWQLSDLVLQHADELAELETLDNGKTLHDTRAVDLPVASEKLRYCAGWATKLHGYSTQIGDPGEYQAFTVRERVGVVAQIIPWNFPLIMAVMQFAPALAAGCTVVLKPAEDTPLTALRLGELIGEGGFPPGVVNILTGLGEIAGAALAGHPDVDKIAFTGSTEVGQAIVRAAAGNLKRVTLELGGKSPMIVLPDADIENVVRGAVTGIFFNSGQSCMAGSRLMVHASIADRVLGALIERSRSIRIGSGFDSRTQIGPLISKVQLDHVLGHVEAGKRAGATVRLGGERIGAKGCFLAPTIFSDTDPAMSIVRDEIFGPVLTVSTFSTEDPGDVAELANDTTYGLAASLWTRDITKAHTLIGLLKVGQVWVNGHHLGGGDLPVGGYKQSGWGRENGIEGKDGYTEVKAVAIALKPAGDWLAIKA